MAKVDTFGGLNNVDDASTLLLGHEGFMELNTAINIDVSDSRKVSRRKGYTELSSGATSYLWANKQYCFFLKGNQLYRLHTDNTEEVIASHINTPVYYSTLHNETLLSFEDKTYSYNGELVLISEPYPTKLEVITSTGPLPAGRYRFKVALRNLDGREFSLTPYEVNSDNTTISQFLVTVNTNQYEQIVYMTTVNGDEFYAVATIAPGDTTANVSSISSYLQLGILDTVPLGASNNMVGFNGRIYFTEDKTLFYSEAHNPLLVKPSTSFYLFPEEVTTVIAVDTGIYVSADKTYFIAGLDPSESSMVEVDPYPIIPGTALNTTHTFLKDVDTSGTQALWRTEEGVNLGTNAGNIYKLTRNKIATPEYSSGAALLRREDGKTQYLSSLAKPNGDVAKFSTTDTITAEIRRNGVII